MWYVIQRKVWITYQSDHPDDKGHLEEAMKIFGMTEADLAALDELEFEQVVEFKAD